MTRTLFSRLLPARIFRTYASSSKKHDLWTAENTVTSPHKSLHIPSVTISDYIWSQMDNYGWFNKTAVVCALSNRAYTYHELYKCSRNLASNFRKLFGIQEGDVICMMIPNTPEYAIGVLGILQAGAEVTTINPNYTQLEFQRQILDSKAKLIISSAESISVIKEGLTTIKKDIPIVFTKMAMNHYLPNGTISFEELMASEVDHTILGTVKTGCDDVALLIYSSGTTGLPKGVELTNKNIVSNIVQTSVDSIQHHKDTTANFQDSIIGIMPFYHVYGISSNLLQKLSAGCKIVTLPKFQPETFLAALKDYQVGSLGVASALISFLINYSGVNWQHLQCIHTAATGGAPIPEENINIFLDKMGKSLKFCQVYGLTETSALVSAGYPGLSEPTSVGCALPNTELKIVDPEMNPLGPDQEGELCVKGPQIMKGYRNNAEATRQSVTDGGWFKTGDLVNVTADGNLFIKDRIKELIKVKSFQVPPAEIENIVKTHPSVEDVAVVGVPDERNGEMPMAFVVLKEEQARVTSTSDIMDYVKQRVIKYKWPKAVQFVDSIPRTVSGKILRRILKDKYL